MSRFARAYAIVKSVKSTVVSRGAKRTCQSFLQLHISFVLPTCHDTSIMISDYACVKNGAYIDYDERIKETLLVLSVNINLYFLNARTKIYASIRGTSLVSAFQDY